MLNVLSVTTPIFLLIAVGFFATRAEWVAQDETRALGGFVLRFAMPALIFKALATRPLGEIADARLIAAYAVASALSFAVVFALFSRGDRRRAACLALGGSAPNSGFVGFPIASLLIGPKAAIALSLCLIVENVVTIPLGITLAESGDAKFVPLVARLARNPLLIAIALGVAASVTGLHPPTPVARAIDVLAASAPAAALIAIGGALVGLKIGGEALDILPVAAAKLLLHPLLMLLLTQFASGADPDVRRSMLIMSSAPVFSIYPLLCRSFGLEQTGAAILLVETALAFPTMSAWALAA